MTLSDIMTVFSGGKDREGKRVDIGKRLRTAIQDPKKGPWINRLLDDRHTPRPIHEGPRFAFQVISREQTPYYAPSRPYLHIQVTNPDSDQSENIASEFLVARLQLKFDDITGPLRGYHTVHYNHGKQIWDFLAQHAHEAELILVNCDAGLCRSSGIAAAIAEGIHGEGGSAPIFEHYIPNPLVYDTVLMAKPEGLKFPPITKESSLLVAEEVK